MAESISINGFGKSTNRISDVISEGGSKYNERVDWIVKERYFMDDAHNRHGKHLSTAPGVLLTSKQAH